MEENRRIFRYNDKEFIFTNIIADEKYGDIVKAISTKLKDFERLYFKKDKEKLHLITDKEILEYIYENYEKIESDVIFRNEGTEQ